MIAGGIDVGAENIKVVILKNQRILSHSILCQGSGSVLTISEKALDDAIKKTELSNTDIVRIATTGIGSEYVSFANQKLTETSCIARGASWLSASIDTVVDIGADKCLVVKVKNGRPINSIRNDRCASGTGRFLKAAAKPLGVDVEEMGRLSLKSEKEVYIENTCAVFAESEIISLIHQKHRREDIAKAVFKGLASRIYTLIMKMGLGKNIYLVGGFGKNAGMLKAMEEQMGGSISVPEEPMIIGALGAALIATESNRDSL